MNRVLALIVCAALLTVCGPLSGLHVHEYATHDHGEHHHAPAAHSHDAAAHHHDASDDADADEHADAHGGMHLEACDPGAHAVSFAFTCATASAPHFALTVDLTFGATVRPPPSRPSLLELSDVRAHSPPRLTDAPLRAPPLVIPA